MATEEMLNNQSGAPMSKPSTPLLLEQNNVEKDFVNAKAYLLQSSSKTGLNM